MPNESKQTISTSCYNWYKSKLIDIRQFKHSSIDKTLITISSIEYSCLTSTITKLKNLLVFFFLLNIDENNS